MTTSQSVQNEDGLTVGTKVLVSVTGIVSLPSYLALALLVFRCVMMILISGRNFRGLSDWAYILAFFGLFAEPLALVMSLLVLPIQTRGRVMVWMIAAGGALAWLAAAWMLPRNLW
jgi:hypothetical protein